MDLTEEFDITVDPLKESEHTEEVCHCGDYMRDHRGMSHNHSPVAMERGLKEESIEFDIMKYGPDIGDGRAGLMTKTKAEAYAKTLSSGFYVIGWVHGTCQSVFKFWVPETGITIELPHAEEPPTGRKAAIMIQKAKGLIALDEE